MLVVRRLIYVLSLLAISGTGLVTCMDSTGSRLTLEQSIEMFVSGTFYVVTVLALTLVLRFMLNDERRDHAP